MDVRDISRLCYGNGFTLWHYKAGETPSAAIGSDGFFNDACGLFAAGDMLLVSGKQVGGLLFITRSDPDGVTVAAMA
jgi:hypothetical protein